MKLFYPILSFLCCLVFAYQWYLGQLVPAWQALTWCVIVFGRDLTDYLAESL